MGHVVVMDMFTLNHNMMVMTGLNLALLIFCATWIAPTWEWILEVEIFDKGPFAIVGVNLQIAITS